MVSSFKSNFFFKGRNDLIIDKIFKLRKYFWRSGRAQNLSGDLIRPTLINDLNLGIRKISLSLFYGLLKFE